MTVLQASLISRTSPLSLSSPPYFPPFKHRPPSLSHCYYQNPFLFPPQFSVNFKKFQSLSHRLSVRCTLNSESIASEDTSFSGPKTRDFDTKDGEFIENGEKVDVSNEVSEEGLKNGDVFSENMESGSEGQNGNLVDEEGRKGKIGIMVFLVGVWAVLKRGYERLLGNGWFSWLPFWRQEKRLERLIAEADAEPKDASKQSALLVELNKHSPESVIKRFEQRDHVVDSRGVAEYLRALVITDAIAEYLPDEQAGKPASLPALVM